jgi:hypothetical protein
MRIWAQSDDSPHQQDDTESIMSDEQTVEPEAENTDEAPEPVADEGESANETAEAKTESDAEPARPFNPDDPIAAAAARAVDGKVAVIERGADKAKIVEGPKPPGGNGAEADKPTAPEPIKVDEADVDTIKETLQTLRNIEAQVAQNRMQYLEKEESLLKHRKEATSDLQSTIKTIGKRQKVPQDWLLNLENMSFEPPKRQPFPFARR